MLSHLRIIPRRSGCGQIKLHNLTHNKLHGRCSGRDISADYEMWRMIKSQANIATRHDILVYFFQANVVGNVATSSPMAKTHRGTRRGTGRDTH